MKAIRLENGWGLDNLNLVTLPDPQPGPDDVVIAIQAVSINPRDRIMLQGGYGRLGGQPPFIPLCDGAGTIAAVGANVTNFEVGDFVIPYMCPAWLDGPINAQSFAETLGGPKDGVMCEQLVMPAASVVKAPAHLNAGEAASLSCAGLTAWNAVVEQGRVVPGSVVLLQGTGGVSLFALQFAKMIGAQVIITSSSDEKLERARQLGADHTINYRTTPDWHRSARALTDGRGVDLVVDVGGAETLATSVAAVKTNGTISLIGVLGGSESTLPLGRVVTQNIRLQGVTLGHCRMFAEMCAAVGQHKLHPVLDDDHFAFDALPAALDRLTEGKHFGKIVCEF